MQLTARCQPSSRHGPARAVPAPPSARGVPDTGCRRGRPPRPPRRPWRMRAPALVLGWAGFHFGTLRGEIAHRPARVRMREKKGDVPKRSLRIKPQKQASMIGMREPNTRTPTAEGWVQHLSLTAFMRVGKIRRFLHGVKGNEETW